MGEGKKTFQQASNETIQDSFQGQCKAAHLQPRVRTKQARQPSLSSGNGIQPVSRFSRRPKELFRVIMDDFKVARIEHTINQTFLPQASANICERAQFLLYGWITAFSYHSTWQLLLLAGLCQDHIPSHVIEHVEQKEPWSKSSRPGTSGDPVSLFNHTHWRELLQAQQLFEEVFRGMPVQPYSYSQDQGLDCLNWTVMLKTLQ